MGNRGKKGGRNSKNSGKSGRNWPKNLKKQAKTDKKPEKTYSCKPEKPNSGRKRRFFIKYLQKHYPDWDK
ncbi:hypothetical protein [uncultured Methanolobus sp.]|uniref:hypothetical protein n=1 Tax=uncultured Methanolobus sp. TaxID=218300 RepID=UPI002AAB410D|nr:hypothetical protein [uncultured Methanolobus sp.]